MRLYFLRHADALDGVNDAARPLSAKGRQQSRAIGRFLEQAGIVLDAAYSSPLDRARQTTDQVLKICGRVKGDEVQVVDSLLNETPPQAFEDWLRTLPSAKHVLLVGHNPSMTDRVRALLGMENSESLELAKGGLMCVRVEGGIGGDLKFYVTPKILGVD